MQTPSAEKLNREPQKRTLRSGGHAERDTYAAREAELCPLLSSSHS